MALETAKFHKDDAAELLDNFEHNYQKLEKIHQKEIGFIKNVFNIPSKIKKEENEESTPKKESLIIFDSNKYNSYIPDKTKNFLEIEK